VEAVETDEVKKSVEESVSTEIEKDYSEDSFDKFLSNEESELLK